MSKNEDIAALSAQYVMNTYSPGVTLVRGRGCKAWDADNMVYLDFTSGVAVQNVGHCHPTVVAAIKEQADTLMHCSNLFFNAKQPLLAERLSKLGLNGKVFFCNSGAEANEAMIKLARFWGHEKGRFEIICMQNSFHGRTMATLSATGQSKVQKGFDPLLLGFSFAEFNNLDSVKAQLNERTVAVMVEAMQGEGGVVPATSEFMSGVRAFCNEHNLLMLCDEVQCGMGRTGKWFGWQNYDVRPDACSMAKALGSGFPIGALMTTPEYSDVFTPGSHASTFGGNPLAASSALATIQVIEEEGLLERAKTVGERFREALQQFVEQYDEVLAVRGEGLLTGVVLKTPAKDALVSLREQGLLACSAGENVVRFAPPLNVTDDELEEAMDMIADAFDSLFGEEDQE